MFLYLCLIWDLGGGVPKVCLSTRRGSSAKPGGSVSDPLRKGGREEAEVAAAITPPPTQKYGRTGRGGEKKKKMPFPFVRSLRPTGNRPADSGRRRPRGNSDAPGQHGNSYSLIIRVRTLPRARKISGGPAYAVSLDVPEQPYISEKSLTRHDFPALMQL